jgi:hypothetical protein
MGTVEITLQAMTAVAARNALLQHPLWKAEHDLGNAIDSGDGERVCEALANVNHVAAMIAPIGWTEAEAAVFSGTVFVDPAVLGDALDREADVIVSRMGENEIEAREGHGQLSILYRITDQLDGAGVPA